MNLFDYDVFATAVPWWLFISMRNRWYIKNFVETGTAFGHTSAIAAKHFGNVYTIELNRHVYLHPVEELTKAANAKRYFGSSAECLPSVVESLNGPTLWYLDSHWCGGDKLGPECPILDELKIMASRDLSKDVIVVDDSGFFFATPPAPHNASEWPRADEVFNAIHGACPSLSVCYFADIIIASPQPLAGIA